MKKWYYITILIILPYQINNVLKLVLFKLIAYCGKDFVKLDLIDPFKSWSRLWFCEGYFSETLHHTLLAFFRIELDSRLPEVDCVLLQTCDQVHDLLTVQQTSHVTNCGVLTHRVLHSVERVVENAVMVADVRRRCLEDSTAEFCDGSEWKESYKFLR